MQISKQVYCVYRCQYHIVWITKYRYKILVEGVKE
ncbi:MAG: transposase, partial [Endomicrobium sp.]|nr:transposase [Endomicrobium sp.]